MASSRPDYKLLGRRMISSSILMFLLVTGLAILIGKGFLSPQAPVELEVSATQTLPWQQGEPLAASVSASLINRQDQPLQLSAPNRCKVFRWVLLRPDDSFVQSENEQGCSDVGVDTVLPPNTSLSDNFTLELDPKRVQPGEYNLMVRFWGKETTVPLTIRPE